MLADRTEHVRVPTQTRIPNLTTILILFVYALQVRAYVRVAYSFSAPSSMLYIYIRVCVCVCKNVFVGAELELSSAITHISSTRSYSVQETVRWRKCATRRDKETKRKKKGE